MPIRFARVFFSQINHEPRLEISETFRVLEQPLASNFPQTKSRFKKSYSAPMEGIFSSIYFR